MKTHENDMKTFHDAMKANEKNKVLNSILCCFLGIFMFSF